jgi:hypothetical protein
MPGGDGLGLAGEVIVEGARRHASLRGDVLDQDSLCASRNIS